MAEQEYKRYSMQAKYAHHADVAYKNHKPAGSHMTSKEKAAYSMGYVKHARQANNAFIQRNPNYQHKTEYGRRAQLRREQKRGR